MSILKRIMQNFDLPLLGVVFGLTLFGLFMLASVSGPLAFSDFHGDTFYFVKHQLIFGVIPGLGGLWVMSRIPYQFWRANAWNLLLCSLVLLVLVFIPGLSADFGTSHSWIRIGGLFSLQPSEVVKLTFLFYMAGWLEKRGVSGVKDFHTGVLPFLTVLGAILFLLILQPDTGTMSIIACMSLSIYFLAGVPWSYLVGLFTLGISGLALLIKLSPYRAERFMTFLHPEADPQGIGYHINQALLAVGSGGLFGLGYGHSLQKYHYLPEVIGDSLIAVIAEEMGFFVVVAIVLAFLFLFWRMMILAKQAPDAFSRYVIVGIAVSLVLQAFVNIGSMIALLPMTGVPLPFMSYGGTNLAISLSAIGVVFNIAKQKRLERTPTV